MYDNLSSASDLFECRVDQSHAGGYTYFCRSCGLECNIGEVSFDCRGGEILPVYIKCRYGCGRAWHLEISPSEKVTLQ